MTKRRQKKSETIEVRVSYDEKNAFMDACRDAGVTASQAIRGYMSEALNPQSQSRARWLYASLILLILVFSGLTYLALTKADTALSAGDRVVAFFDVDDDALLTRVDLNAVSAAQRETFAWLLSEADTNADQALSAAEIDAIAQMEIDLMLDPAATRSPATAEADRTEILLFPPDMSPSEQARLIDDIVAKRNLDPAGRERLVRLLKALSIDQDRAKKAGDQTPSRSNPESP